MPLPSLGPLPHLSPPRSSPPPPSYRPRPHPRHVLPPRLLQLQSSSAIQANTCSSAAKRTCPPTHAPHALSLFTRLDHNPFTYIKQYKHRRLSGYVEVGGAKNSCLVLIAAALLSDDGPLILRNVPHLRDIDAMSRVLQSTGCRVERIDTNSLMIDPSTAQCAVPDADAIRALRASFLVIAPLLSRYVRTHTTSLAMHTELLKTIPTTTRKHTRTCTYM